MVTRAIAVLVSIILVSVGSVLMGMSGEPGEMRGWGFAMTMVGFFTNLVAGLVKDGAHHAD